MQADKIQNTDNMPVTEGLSTKAMIGYGFLFFCPVIGLFAILWNLLYIKNRTRNRFAKACLVLRYPYMIVGYIAGLQFVFFALEMIEIWEKMG